MLAATGNIQPPQLLPSRALEELPREPLGNPQMPFVALPGSLSPLVITPYIDRAHRRKGNCLLNVTQDLIGAHVHKKSKPGELKQKDNDSEKKMIPCRTII